MKIVVAGASGVIGRSLIPLLIEAGHEVVGMIRNPAHAGMLERAGAQHAIADVYDRDAVFAAIRDAKPDAVIHQLTALGERNFAENARIRKEGTRSLVDASLAAGVRRMIVQSISWVYAPGEDPAAEEEPLDLEAPEPRGTTVGSVAYMEEAAAELPESVILRCGLLYGEGTWYAAEGWMTQQVREGKVPATAGVSSFVHVEDAARAALQALDWPSGVYNIVDQEPAAGTEWLPGYAGLVGAPAPSIQQGGNAGWERGALNAKAVRQGWLPRYGSWRVGFPAVLGG